MAASGFPAREQIGLAVAVPRCPGHGDAPLQLAALRRLQADAGEPARPVPELLQGDEPHIHEPGERLGLHGLHPPPGHHRGGEPIPCQRHAHNPGRGHRAQDARRVRLARRDGLHRPEEPGRHLLHELAAADSVPHPLLPEGGLPHADQRRGAAHEEHTAGAPEPLLQDPIPAHVRLHENAHQVVWVGHVRLLHAARRAGAQPGPLREAGGEDEGHQGRGRDPGAL
mmetsp:Transcript_3627/g.8665  ORF Transcript_3627/g.8665 Transcript_3627/m.8665 type:complete len:226 (-) Transcript_3627:995-1672(-)